MARKQKAEGEAGVEVRLLQDCLYGNGNDVVEIPADQLAGAKEQGLCDDDPGAVAYAKTLPQNSSADTDSVA